MSFIRYQHIERLGKREVDGILDGLCYIFPKLDGTNGSIWVANGDPAGEFQFGSRNKHLKGTDNHGFRTSIMKNQELLKRLNDYFGLHPDTRLFGEWMVPHTVTGYRDEVWRRFWVFDVGLDTGNGLRYLPYRTYQPWLNWAGLDYIPTEAVVDHPSMSDLILRRDNNTWMMKEGEVGEGIVIKRYDFVNRYDATVWAKLVRGDYNPRNKAPKPKPFKDVEQAVVERYLTPALIRKEFAKIEDWNKKKIPELIGRVFHVLINEEIWDIVKRYKNPIIDFKKLKRKTVNKIREVMPDLF